MGPWGWEAAPRSLHNQQAEGGTFDLGEPCDQSGGNWNVYQTVLCQQEGWTGRSAKGSEGWGGLTSDWVVAEAAF